MRKIVSKHEEEKKKKRNQVIIGGVLIAVMLLSTLGYAFQSILTGNTGTNSSQTVSYNGINFVNQNGFWAFSSGNERFVFTYNPTEISSTNLSSITMSSESLSNRPVYIYSSDINADSELRLNLRNIASQVLEKDQALQSPNCGDNSIIIQNGTLGLRQEQNCVFISGQGEDLIKLVDNFLFKILGIRK